MATLGERLKQLRLQAGLSQGELAQDDLSASYVSLIESGKRQPSPAALRTLASRLGVSVESLNEDPHELDARTRLHELEIAYIKLALSHGEHTSARERLTHLLEQPGLDAATRDEAVFLLARSYERDNDLVGAARTLMPVYERCIAGECDLPVADVSLAMCGYYLDSGDLHAAVRVGSQGVAAVERRGMTGSDEHLRLSSTLMWAYFELGDFLHCRLWAERLVTIAEGSGASRGRASIYWNAAFVAEAAGSPLEALRYCERALAILGEMGRERDLPRLKVDAALLLLTLDPQRITEAVTLLDDALPDLRDLGSPPDLALWGSVRSIAEIMLGHGDRAEQLARQALLHFSAHPGFDLARTLLILGDSLVAQGRHDEGMVQYRSSREVLDGCPTSRRTATLWRQLAERLQLAGRPDEALAAYARGLDAAGVHTRSHVADVAFGLHEHYAVKDRAVLSPSAPSAAASLGALPSAARPS
ncbi:MAG: helix-turn-helix transcriptional regulator [Kineosporiaceae bacterium]